MRLYIKQKHFSYRQATWNHEGRLPVKIHVLIGKKGRCVMKKFGFVIPVIFALAVFLTGIVLAAVHAGESRQVNDVSAPVKPEITQKMKKLHVPFIANEGQADEGVKYYANTFAGSVFVTKDGEIVYSLPSGRDVPAGASQESGRGHEAGGQGSGGARGKGRVAWASPACPCGICVCGKWICALFPR